MTVGNREALFRSLDELPVAAILTDLTGHAFVAVNHDAAVLFGAPAADLVGDDVLAHIHPEDRDAARLAYGAMADQVIDGYQVRRRIIRPGGSAMTVGVWGRRVEGPGTLCGLWVLIPDSQSSTAVELPMSGTAAFVIAVTDHDWQIEYINDDAGLLGVRGAEIRDRPLLGLVHPSAASAFLAAAARTSSGQMAVSVLLRMRAGPEQWADRYCLIVRMCEHQPPRLGVVISEAPESAQRQAAGVLDRHLRHAALEARVAGTLGAIPMLSGLPVGTELSGRQTEIVSRLIAGERTTQIARSMYLSPATIRNHLTAIYRKVGVHSQAELLATLLRAATPGET